MQIPSPMPSALLGGLLPDKTRLLLIGITGVGVRSAGIISVDKISVGSIGSIELVVVGISKLEETGGLVDIDVLVLVDIDVLVLVDANVLVVITSGLKLVSVGINKLLDLIDVGVEFDIVLVADKCVVVDLWWWWRCFFFLCNFLLV